MIRVRYKDDCLRIKRIAMEHFGERISLFNAESIWNAHSDTYCAGWLFMNDKTDEEMAEIIEKYL